MATPIILGVAIGALMVVSIIEIALISSMVAWLHNTANGTFAVNFDGSTFDLRGKPKNLIVDQGHSSNGAAGTALILVGFGGILILWLRNRPNILGHRFTAFIYHAWLVLTVLALMLTLGSLAYVFAVTNAHEGQTIDVALASTLGNSRYPIDVWAPQNWFSALLRLDLADVHQRTDIEANLHIMRGWEYNLIPLFVIQLVTTILLIWDFLKQRRTRPVSSKYGSVEQNPQISEHTF